MSPEQVDGYVRAKLESLRGLAGGTHEVDRVGGILLYGTIGFAAYLRPDGSVIFEEAVDWAGGSNEYQLRTATAQEAAGAIHAAIVRLPELTSLLPVRRPENECTVCRGTGGFIRADGLRFDGIWCERCSSLGYLIT